MAYRLLYVNNFCITTHQYDRFFEVRQTKSSLQCLSVPVTSGDQESESHNSSEEAHLSPRGHQQCPGTPTETYGVLLRDCLEKPSRQTFVGIGDSPQIAKLQIGVVSRVWLQNLLAGLQRLTNADAVPKSGATCTVTCGNSSPLNPISGTDRPGFTREHRATGTTKTRRSASSRRASPMSRERFVPSCNTSQLNSKFPIFVPVDYKSAHGVTRPFRLRPESNSGIRSSKQLSHKVGHIPIARSTCDRGSRPYSN
ncbi:unnamed protein product [Dicrocoelium dendriticum]|nr:unnamed protein product [Dicrocoelium dendriticum]